jgi:peroxiredoxin
MKKMYLPAVGVLAVMVLVMAPNCRSAEVEAAPAAPAGPETQPAAKVSNDARQVLDQVSAAYGKLHSLNLAGTITVELQVDGSDPAKHSTTFHSCFVAPNKFRHEVKDDVLVGSTGQKLYTFVTDDNAYLQDEAPEERVASKDLPKPMATLLAMQDPSLLLAMSKSPADELLAGVTDATKAQDTPLDGVLCPTLKLAQKDKTADRLMVDPQTHLIRRFQADMTDFFKQRRPDLARAVVTVDYTKSVPDSEAAHDELFAWSPPPGAKDAEAMAAARPLDNAQASELEGKPAPQFKLDSIQGKPVSLADLNGKVVVLDFWATWCGPCRASLPHLNDLYNEFKDKGLAVYAIDQQEDKQDVSDFVVESKLTLPVLLDPEGKVGAQYGVEGIPQTVVIGKDGKIRKVYVGFGDELVQELRQVVQDAMKQ